MITNQQSRQFSQAGAVTIETPLTAPQIAAASAALDRLLPLPKHADGQAPRYRASLTCSYYDAELVDILQHPFFEQVAQTVLQADQVRFFQTAINVSYPQPHTPFSFEQHVDIQYGLSDYHRVPKGIICSFFLWLSDVNEQRAPMMVRPGSHWLLAEEREHRLGRNDQAPQVASVPLAHLPALDYADPIPLVAKAGQVSVLTTATVHGASVNVDTVPRKNMVITFTAAGVQIGLSPEEERQRQEYNRRLKPHLRPERAYIVPE